jgi:hypothetical protein
LTLCGGPELELGEAPQPGFGPIAGRLATKPRLLSPQRAGLSSTRNPREGDRLIERATNQPEFEIFPESDKDCFLKVVDAHIRFMTDAEGRATELVPQQGGAESKRVE